MFAPFDLSGKVALITGGASSIGFGVADALARAGADIVLWDVNADSNREAADKLRAHGVRVLAQEVDVSDEGQVKAGVGAALAELGRIDTGVACAGIFMPRTAFVDATLDDWKRVHAVNAEGVFLTLREISRHMVKRAEAGDPGGSLVAFSSIANFKGSARSAGYGATKGAVPSLMRALAAELGRYGIRSNTIAPGWTSTQSGQGAFLDQSDFFKEKIIPRIPLGRAGSPADFGGIMVYLASDASAYHTGDLFLIDGGYIVS